MEGIFMWYLQESNQGHTDFQSVALPTELRYLLKECKYSAILFFAKQKTENIKKSMPVIYYNK